MKTSTLAAGMFLTAALWGCGDDDRAFRTATLASVATLGATYQELIKARHFNATELTIYYRAAPLGDQDLTRLARENWLASETVECRLEMRLRAELTRIEKHVKDTADGVYPAWLTQERDWQMVDTHILQSKFIDLKDDCKPLGTSS